MSNEREDKLTAAATDKETQSKKFSWVNIGILCSAFSIIVLVIVGGYGYKYLIAANMQMSAIVEQAKIQVQQLQLDFNELKKMVNASQQTIQLLAQEIKNLPRTASEIPQAKQNQLDKSTLPVRNAPETKAVSNLSSQPPCWQQGIRACWQALKDMVIIRHNVSEHSP
jgi:FtsZ-binding cell division protein ZapB